MKSTHYNNLIFVYGTLKKEEANHPILVRNKAEFVSQATTVEKYPLVVGTLPFLYDQPGKGRYVSGEIYLLPDPGTALAELDRLEGHPSFYKRGYIRVKDEAGNVVVVWTYFYQGARRW